MPSERPFIEDCNTLDSKQFRTVFAKIKNQEEVNDIVRTNLGATIPYWSEYEADSFLVVAVEDCLPQRIVLTTVSLQYGKRTLFRCPCGYRAAKLYLPNKGEEFKCRTCWNLRYKASNFNKTNMVAKLERVFNLENKVTAEANAITRPAYNGVPTKRAVRFQGLFHKLWLLGVRHEKDERRKVTNSIISGWERSRSQCI